jgi:hypothetical protein
VSRGIAARGSHGDVDVGWEQRRTLAVDRSVTRVRLSERPEGRSDRKEVKGVDGVA